MKYLIVLLFLITNMTLQAQEDRRQEIISVIDEELAEVARLNKQTGSRRPRLLLRMAELFLEKARIIKDAENKKFLSLSAQKRRKTDKKRYFKQSRKFFVKAQKTCYYILKRFPKFSGKGDVYYILAYNAKEFQQPGRAEKFFNRALRHGKKNSRTSYRARLALAEIYYNKRQYAKAIPLYEKALRKRDNKWWTKDAYNLAWCYFRIGKRKQAISKMREVYSLSKQGRFIDMSYAVERDLAFYYAESGQMKQAVAFYKSIGKDIGKNLLKVAKYLQEQGKYSKAETVLTVALRYKTDQKSEINIQVTLLGLYERFGKIRGHLRVSKSLFDFYKAGALDDSDKAILLFNVKKMSAVLQGQVVSKRYRTQKRLRRRKASRAVEYFKMLSELEPKTSHTALFHAAETFYAINYFESAIPLYQQAADKAKAVGDNRIFNLSMDGILSAVNGRGVKATTREKYLIPSYERFLERNPKGQKSFKIYQRLFNAYIDKKDLPNAEKTLLKVRDIYPKESKIHQAMLGRVMDHYKKTNNREGIKTWVNRISNGDFKVTPKYAKTVKKLLLSLQFENVEKANSQGDKKKALQLYLDIYNDKTSTKDARKNAAYNIAVLYHELGDTDKSYSWGNEALGLMDASDVQRFQTAFITIAAELFNRRLNDKSVRIYSQALEKLCRRKSRNKKILFRNAIIILLADGKILEANEVLRKSLRCNIEQRAINDASLDILDAMIAEKSWNQISIKMRRLIKDDKILPDLLEPMSRLAKAYRNNGKLKDEKRTKNQILVIYNTLKKKKRKIPLAGLDVVANLKMVNLETQFSRIKKIKLSFPEARFNTQLKKKFEQLDRITASAVNVLEIGSGRGIVKAYRYLISSYRDLVKEVRDFVPPKKPEAYVSSFRQTMTGITRPIVRKANEFNREALRHIKRNKILSDDNLYFLSNNSLPLEIRYNYHKDGMIMDRGGRP